mmetsp:Transcript_4894/g.5776  ORF Transcript_4894/g.5776 Transcript_4894/m.5776 type:complete len:173 (-) Transcript_4894:33-551(-)
MSVKGVRQLKSIRFFFCDIGGSSHGARKLLKSNELVEFMKQHNLKLDIYLKRGHHPCLSATYINGFIRDVPIKSYNQDKIIDSFMKLWKSLGRRPLKHNSAAVSKEIPSIQGKWRDDLWNTYPKHEMEHKDPPPPITDITVEERKEKIIKKPLHPTTRILRDKPTISHHGLG